MMNRAAAFSERTRDILGGPQPMESETLLRVANDLRDVNRRLWAAEDDSVEMRRLLEHQTAIIDLLAKRLEDREKAVLACSHSMADRINNLLMAIQTIADQLRSREDSAGTDPLGTQLEQIIRGGRESLKVLREAVAQLV